MPYNPVWLVLIVKDIAREITGAYDRDGFPSLTILRKVSSPDVIAKVLSVKEAGLF